MLSLKKKVKIRTKHSISWYFLCHTVLSRSLKNNNIAALYTMAKCWKQHKCPSVNEWIKKLCTTMEYYTAERKTDRLPFATAWMELESIMLNEIRQVVKDKYHVVSPTSGT